MILKWLQHVISGRRHPEAPVVSPSFPNAKLLDIAHEVLSKEALDKQVALHALEKYGWPLAEKKKFQQRVKAKVKQFLGFAVTSNEEEDLVDEVTERITETAEADPYYKSLFDADDASTRK